jgi:hypothetical protein
LINSYQSKTSLIELGQFLTKKSNNREDFMWFSNIN